jgi:putative alpha-1,2-mannosidase
MLDATKIDLRAHMDFVEQGYCQRYTHILDICEALSAMSKIARQLNENNLAEQYEELATKWINAFDVSTGMMSTNSPYYEGTNKNYSFRLLHNMEERINILGKERFIEELDELFGYTREPVERPTFPIIDPLDLGINSFEGFNNESDMEAPYAYLFAERHDRVCEIVRSGMRYMFTKGRGGLPGNNDSGGLSSCYIWNAIGLFPVSGQDLMLIGSPIIDEATLRLSSGKELSITVHDNSDNNIYVKRIIFNCKDIENYQIPVSNLMNGGTLEFFMSSSPNV